MLSVLRPPHVYEVTMDEILAHTRRPLSVVAVALRDLHARGVVRRRIIEGQVYWSINYDRSEGAHHRHPTPEA